MASEPDLRREAADRVNLRFDRQTAALDKVQREERESDARRQSWTIADSVTRQSILEQDKAKALNEHDQRWREARDRLTPRPSPAPSFDMMGGPPRRNLAKDYHDMRERADARRKEIETGFDQDIATLAATRAEKCEQFGRANEARDRGHREDRAQLAERHQQSFDRLVKQELDRADKWTSREFKQRSRDRDAREL
jgi:hypothetical protein